MATRRGELASAKCYVHFRPAPHIEPAFDIQYWFFYPYNGDITARQNQIQERLSTANDRDVPLLNLQVTFDEARWWLTALRAAGQFVTMAHIPLVWVAATFLPILIPLGIATGGAESMESVALLFAFAGPLSSAGMVLVVLPTAIVLCALRGLRFGLGEGIVRERVFVGVQRPAIPAVMTSLYSDPANAYVDMTEMVFIARDKLAGQDVDQRLQEARRRALERHRLVQQALQQ